MKHIYIFLLIVISFHNGCTFQSKANVNQDMTAKKDTIINTVEKNVTENSFTMTIEQSVLKLSTDSIVTVSIQNNTSLEGKTDLFYNIDYLNGDTWINCEFSEDIFFDAILIILPPCGASVNSKVYLYPQYYNYTSGRYRIHKEVSAGGQKYDLYTEFNIE